MKIFNIISIITVLFFAACSSNSKVSENNEGNLDSLQKDTSLTAILRVPSQAKLGDSVNLDFVVYNTTDSVRQFCKWHTPFEPLMSKYLDVISTEGVEAEYQGPMAKRMMPPPADSYVSINPGDSLKSVVNLNKAYRFPKAGKYVIKYNSVNMSGIMVKDSVVLNLVD
ncbi:hypothetical protein A5893_03845 [Pedobacter psychrophilus]|uniref:Protease n=1 Tax=Pedobacter psychrophilus TaxID=1826909 RepID=A0A179DMV0_9SPHI|nr:hypothetical protein [Pedobacter psychrophilus]OAQ42254.1 hypothetical protein A5893_03845 [Pedobacter psychrophilus]